MNTCLQIFESIITFSFFFLMLGGLYLTVYSRFFQIRALKKMFGLLFSGNSADKASAHKNTISPIKALWTAMSTTIGIGNIFGPIVAIAFGGPGALLAYVFAAFLGSILTYSEVFLAIKNRRLLSNGTIEGGPMAYIERAVGLSLTKVYALCCSLLLVTWSMSQSHTLCHMAGSWQLPFIQLTPNLLGLFLAVSVIFFLYRGIELIAELNTRMVPFMFMLYVFSTGYIIFSHIDILPRVFYEIFSSFFSQKALLYGVGSHSIFQTLRWGFARAIQSNEAGVGTSAIPHSLSQENRADQQAILAMVSVYANGFICLLSGLTLLVSDRVSEIQTQFDVTLITRIFDDHFSIMGQPIFVIVAFLFAFGTILGNAFNGSKCFAFITKGKAPSIYIFLVGIGVYLGGQIDLRLAWSIIDYFIVPVTMINLVAMLITLKRDGYALYDLKK